MNFAILRLTAGDEALLGQLTTEDADFDLEDTPPRRPLAPGDAARFLADNPGAVEYYQACGFEAAEDQPTIMLRTGP